MSTLNVGAMAARLGLDPAEFLDKMRGVEGFTSGLNNRMSAEMKRTSREGAESFRLIDEALGIHVSRPITKILTKEFPAFASALQSVMGAGLVGALAAIGVGIAEHISKKMEEAKKHEEEYADAVRNTRTVIAEAHAESERRLNETLGRDAGVRGDRSAEAYYKGLATDAANVERLAKFTDHLTESLRREVTALAALEPHMAAVAEWWHELWTSSGTLGIEKISNGLKSFQEKFAELSHQDALKQTGKSAEYLNAELVAAQQKLDQMPTALREVIRPVGRGVTITDHVPLYSPEEIAAQKLVLDRIKEIKEEQGREVANASADKRLERDTEAKHMSEEVAKAIEKIREGQKRVLEESIRLGKELHGALDKSDEIQRLDDAFKSTLATLAQYRALVGGAAFFKEFGVSADQLAEQLSKVTGQLESQAQLKRFLEETKEKKGDAVPAFPMLARPPAMPELVHGGSVAGELAAFAEEPRKQIEMMKKAFEEALTPVDKFKIAQRELDLILKNADGTFRSGAEGAAAYAGAMRHVTEEEEKALAGSRKAADGLHAFWMELQQGEASGKFAFSFASDAFKGLDDGIAKTILATRNQHHELKLMWQNYFKSLEEMAIKFALSKSFASLANLGSPNAGGGAGAAGGLAGLLAKLFGMGSGASGGAAATTAAAGAGGDMGMFAGFFAEGGDVSPGSSFISGEAGAEKVNLDSRGGAHITPLGGKGGGDTHYHFDQRGAVVTEDLVRRAEAAQMIHTSSQQAVAQSVSMSQEIAKRSRPTR
jgi:hypothetical protein